VVLDRGLDLEVIWVQSGRPEACRRRRLREHAAHRTHDCLVCWLSLVQSALFEVEKLGVALGLLDNFDHVFRK